MQLPQTHTANVGILVVSPSYLASEACRDEAVRLCKSLGSIIPVVVERPVNLGTDMFGEGPSALADGTNVATCMTNQHPKNGVFQDKWDENFKTLLASVRARIRHMEEPQGEAVYATVYVECPLKCMCTCFDHTRSTCVLRTAACKCQWQ